MEDTAPSHGKDITAGTGVVQEVIYDDGHQNGDDDHVGQPQGSSF